MTPLRDPLRNPTDPIHGGLSLLGTPLKEWRKTRAYQHAKSIGLNSATAEECVSKIAEQYERDEPYKAQRIGLNYVDLTGYYRIMAALLADPDNNAQIVDAILQDDPIAPRFTQETSE